MDWFYLARILKTRLISLRTLCSERCQNLQLLLLGYVKQWQLSYQIFLLLTSFKLFGIQKNLYVSCCGHYTKILLKVPLLVVDLPFFFFYCDEKLTFIPTQVTRLAITRNTEMYFFAFYSFKQ